MGFSHLKYNLLLIGAGIIAGLFLGGMFGWWLKPNIIIEKIITPVKDLTFPNKNTDNTYNKVSESPSFYSKQNDTTDELPDTTKIDDLYPDISKIDSLMPETSIQSITDNEIVVKKDVLIASKEIMLPIINPKSQISKLDSLLTDEEKSKSPKQYCKIELWRSPLNYNGYKFSGNKLIVYGLSSLDYIEFIQHNKQLFLKNENSYYLIEQANEYKPLRPLQLNF